MTTESIIVGEIIGTVILILLGDGVVAGVLLAKSKAQNAGWIVITAAWAMAVFCGVVVSAPMSGAHLNPAVTVGLAVAGSTPWGQVPIYIVSQFIGAFIGATLVGHPLLEALEVTEDRASSSRSSAPAPRSATRSNLIWRSSAPSCWSS